MTSYQGGLSFTDSGALRVSTATNGALGNTKIGLIGDSIALRGFGNPGTITSMQVISATEVQVNMTNHAMSVGNKLMVGWTNQDLLSGYCTQVLSVISTSAYTIPNPGITGTYPITVTGQNGVGLPIIYDLAMGYQTGYAPWIIATQSAGTYFNLFSVNALSGATSVQIDTYCVANALKMSAYPDEWWYMPGANDAGVYTVAQSMATINSTMNKLLATGKTIRLFTPSPRSGSASLSAFLQQLRQQEIETYKNNPQVIIFDLNKWLIDPLSITGDWKSGYSLDSVHPQPTACYAAAKGFWSDMKLAGSSLLPNISPLFPVSQNDNYEYASAVGYSNVMKNPMLTGINGTRTSNSGSPLPQGTVASYFSVVNNVGSFGGCTSLVCTSQTARTDGNPGYWQNLVATTAGNAAFQFYYEQQGQNGVNANIANMGAGWYVFGCEVNISNVTNTIKYIQANFTFNVTTTQTQVWYTLLDNTEAWVAALNNGNDTLTLLGTPVYISAMETTGYWQPQFRVGMTGTGSATFNFGRPFMRRINV